MPVVSLQDAWGAGIQVATTDRELLRMWLAEWLPRVYPPELPADAIPTIYLRPLENPPGSGQWDWLTDSRALSTWLKLPASDPDGVLEFLDRYRAEWTPEKWKAGEI
jgi:hypothetical protein